MPAIAFPAWWHIASKEPELHELYSEYNTNRPKWKAIKYGIKKLGDYVVSRYCSPYRGDPVILSYMGLVEGIIERAREDPVLIFPSIAIETLDDEKFDEKAVKLLELIEKTKEYEFDEIKTMSKDLAPFSDFSTENFHPMLVEAVGCAIGTFVTRAVAADIVGDEIIETCYKGDKLYAKGIADWAEQLAEEYEKSSEAIISLIGEGDWEKTLEIQLQKNVSGELLEILSPSLSKLAETIQEGLTSLPGGIIICKEKVKERVKKKFPDVKTKSEMNSKKLLKNAISQIKKL